MSVFLGILALLSLWDASASHEWRFLGASLLFAAMAAAVAVFA